MDRTKLLYLQTQRGAKTVSSEVTTKSLNNVTNDCRRVIKDATDRYRDLDIIAKRETIRQIIIDYVMNNKPLVEGYIDSDNNPDTMKLVDKLIEDITNYGILTNAMNDENVYEIRCNCKELKIERAGRVEDLRDRDGNIVSFESAEQQDIVLRKLLGDTRLTPKNAVVNARTFEGYRIAAVHSSAISPDPNDPTAEQYHAFVLRKFRKTKMDLGEIVKKGTMSDNMARLLALSPAGGLTFLTVGPTASGKTTTNNAILQAVPATTRTVLLQNPSEIDLRFKDPSGRVYNDVLHLEAKERENPIPSDPTMENLMDHTLRLSPTFVCFGELRTNKEFKMGMKIAQAGHPINCTFHSESSVGAVRRFLTAYLAESGNEPSHLALINLADLVHIIIVQKIMRDGQRRVIQISEFIGVSKDDKEQPEVRDIFIFEPEDPVYASDGSIKKIDGVHKRVGCISEKMIRKFQLEGVARSRYDFLLTEPKETEMETYTGLNIDHYGMVLSDAG